MTNNRKRLSENSVSLLGDLFDTVSPSELREHLLEMYQDYIIKNHEDLPINFPQMAETMKHLFYVLKCMEDESLD